MYLVKIHLVTVHDQREGRFQIVAVANYYP